MTHDSKSAVGGSYKSLLVVTEMPQNVISYKLCD